MQYLNCRGDASPHRDWAFPIEIERPPIEIWAFPHQDLSAGRWEEKDVQSPVKCRTKFRGNNDAEEKTVQPPAKFFFFLYYFFGDHLFLAGKKPWIWDLGQKKRLSFGKDLFLNFFGNHWIFTAPQSNSRPIKIWVNLNKIGSNFQKSLFLCEILATRLILTKVLSMLQKRPPCKILQFKSWLIWLYIFCGLLSTT